MCFLYLLPNIGTCYDLCLNFVVLCLVLGTVQSVLQCAGNRRNEMAAIKLVEGRAPWNHGQGAERGQAACTDQSSSTLQSFTAQQNF
jgi:hypothetical protein